MLGKITGYGYKKIGFILDRGYFSRGNIRYLDECGYSFVIMAKGMSSFISDLILENKGTFENKKYKLFADGELIATLDKEAF